MRWILLIGVCGMLLGHGWADDKREDICAVDSCGNQWVVRTSIYGMAIDTIGAILDARYPETEECHVRVVRGTGLLPPDLVAEVTVTAVGKPGCPTIEFFMTADYKLIPVIWEGIMAHGEHRVPMTMREVPCQGQE